MTFKKSSQLSQRIRDFNSKARTKSWRLYADVITLLLEDYPTEVGARVLGYLQTEDISALLTWADSYGGAQHATAEEAYSANQLVALIKKYPFTARALKKSARDTAVEKFRASEKRCGRYNLKFIRKNQNIRMDLDADVLQSMSAWISHVIGYKPCYGQIYQECDFGPGASIGVHGQNTNSARKLLSPRWSCTPSALPYALSALAQDFHIWEVLLSQTNGIFCLDFELFREEALKKIQLVQHNKIVFVPKTAIVDRTIAVEPLLNGYIQKGTDIVMRQFLKRVGLDISDQGRNQELARLGSLPDQNDPFVTIDLSSASDSVSTEVVRRLLPPEWFEFLNSIRAKEYELLGAKHRYNKFVSMGNGFCFPLETLLFASVCNVFCSPGDFVVYGDDIIVRQSVSANVIATLRKLGFRQNPDKTFLHGPFRESCGADWYSGLDIRPLTLDYAFDSAESIMKFHNMSMRKPLWFKAFRKVRELLLASVPESLRLVRPFEGNVDSAFEVPMDIFQSSKFAKWNRKIRAWEWTELMHSSLDDKEIRVSERYPAALMRGALRGATSNCPFAVRRKTKRTMRKTSHAGASSLWLPPIRQ